MVELFFKGLIIALVFGVPAGAIGILTIQRTMEHGFTSGFVTGLGSSAADVLYACVGVFGITLISDFLTLHQSLIQLFGGILIIIFGITIIFKKERQITVTHIKKHLVLYFLSSFTTAIMNPVTIISFLIAFTTFGIEGPFQLHNGILLISGILLGTVCWWIAISGIVTFFRKRITAHIYKWMNRILGTFMMIFGIIMVIANL